MRATNLGNTNRVKKLKSVRTGLFSRKQYVTMKINRFWVAKITQPQARRQVCSRIRMTAIYAVPRMDFRNPKNLEAGKREAEATPKQQQDLYDVEKFEKVSTTQMSVNPLESNKF